MTLPQPDMTISLQRMIVRWPTRDLRKKRTRVLSQWAEVQIVDDLREELNSLVGVFHSFQARLT